MKKYMTFLVGIALSVNLYGAYQERSALSGTYPQDNQNALLNEIGKLKEKEQELLQERERLRKSALKGSDSFTEQQMDDLAKKIDELNKLSKTITEKTRDLDSTSKKVMESHLK